jgi:hypothetical protein
MSCPSHRDHEPSKVKRSWIRNALVPSSRLLPRFGPAGLPVPPAGRLRGGEGELVDRVSIHEPELTSVEGYRLIWYHSTRREKLDALARQ